MTALKHSITPENSDTFEDAVTVNSGSSGEFCSIHGSEDLDNAPLSTRSVLPIDPIAVAPDKTLLGLPSMRIGGTPAEQNRCAPVSKPLQPLAASLVPAASPDAPVLQNESKSIGHFLPVDSSSASPVDERADHADLVEDSTENRASRWEEQALPEQPVTDSTSNEEGGNDASLTHEEMLAAANAHRLAGNDRFKAREYDGALAEYTAALRAAPESSQDRAVYHANAAACHAALGAHRACIEQATEALQYDAAYVKALYRRMGAFEALDELEQALADGRRVLELNPRDVAVQRKVALWTPIVKERQEAMKEEMLGKLKDLGNTVLSRFGMSLDNFKMDKDPNTGGYSVSFQQ